MLSSHTFIVKLQSKLNSPVQFGPGVDFVFPLSQEQQEEEQPSPKKHLQLNNEFDSSAAQLLSYYCFNTYHLS